MTNSGFVPIIELLLLMLSGVITWLFHGSREHRRPAGEFLFLSIISSFSFVVIGGFVLILFSLFNMTNLTILIYIPLITSVVIKTLKTKKTGSSWKDALSGSVSCPLRPKPARYHIIFFLIFLVISALYFKPAEYLIGGFDPGIYVNTGINLASEGTTIFRDPLINEIGYEKARRFLGLFTINPIGIWILNQFEGTMASQFYPGLPILYALSYKATGLRSFLYLQPLISILCLFSLFYFAKKSFGRVPAAVATVLYAFNIITLWFSRYPVSEPLSVMFISGGLYLLLSSYEKDEALCRFMGGLLLASALLTRPDAALVLLPLSLFFYLKFIQQKPKRGDITFVFITILGFAASVYYGITKTGGYLHGLILSFIGIGIKKEQSLLKILLLITLVLLALATAAILYIKRLQLIDLSKRKQHLLKFLPTVIAGISLSLIIFQFFIRPMLPFAFLSPNDNSLIRLGWYFAPLALGWENLTGLPIPWNWMVLKAGVLIAALSVVYSLEKSRDYKKWLFNGVWLTYAILYFQNLRIEPTHLWINRRYLSFILFGLLISLAVLITSLWKSKGGCKHFLRTASALALLFFLFSFVSGAITIANHHEMHGLGSSLRTLAKKIPENSFLIIDNSPPYILESLHLPLKTIFKKDITKLKNNSRYIGSLPKMLKVLEGKYGSIVYLTPDRNGGEKIPGHWALITSHLIDIPVLEKPGIHDYRPALKVLHHQMPIYIHHYVSEKKLDTLKGFVDIGTKEDLFFLKGNFYDRETEGNKSYRWIADEAEILLPAEVEGQKITIILASGRPEKTAPTPQVLFEINGNLIGSPKAKAKYAQYEIQIPKNTQSRWGCIQLKIKPSTWKPSNYGLSDNRALGVKLVSIRW